MDSGRASYLFKRFAGALAYVATKRRNGSHGIGSAFHVGEGVFVTARHVLEDAQIREIATTEQTYVYLEGEEAANSRLSIVEDGRTRRAHLVDCRVFELDSGPFFHPQGRDVDACFRVKDLDPRMPWVRLGGHLDDWLGSSDFVLIFAKAKEPHRTWYGLAAETGLRAGELCGVTVDDIDLERGDPKTDESIRVVELSPQACRHLRTFLESWHPNQRRLLFATRNGTPWDQNTLLKRKFKPLLRALGIQVPRGNGFHAFRHANATLMSSFGASQKLRQQRLGHADGSPVTETIYTHVISEDGKRIAAQLGNAVWGILDASWTEKENGRGVESPKPFVIN